MLPQRSRPHALHCSLVLAALCALAAAAADAATFVYVHDRSDPNQVFAFELAKNGDLAPVPGSPFVSEDPTLDTCGGQCQTMAADKKSARLFTSGDTGVSVWDVAADGSLTPVPGSPFSATTDECEGVPCPIFGVAAVRVKKRLFVYAAEPDLNQLRGFEVQADGTLVELPSSPFPTGGLDPIGVSAAKRLLFATNEDDSTIASYFVANDGTLVPAPGSPLAIDPPPVFVFNATPDAKGKRLYVVDDGFDDPLDEDDIPIGVYAFSVDKKTGALTPVGGSPFDSTIPVENEGATGGATAKKLLVAAAFEAVNQDLQVFKIGKGGSLTPLGGAQDSGLNVLALTFDPKGKLLLLASLMNVRVSQVSKRTGEVVPVEQEPITANEVNAILVLKR